MAVDNERLFFKYNKGHCGGSVYAIMKDGQAWFFARQVLDNVGLGYLSIEELLSLLNYKLDPDETSSVVGNWFGSNQEVPLINISGVYALKSIWLNDEWNNIETEVEKFLGWVRDENILSQILNQTVTAN